MEWIVDVFLVLYFQKQSSLFVYRVSRVLFCISCFMFCVLASCILCFVNRVSCVLCIVYLVLRVCEYSNVLVSKQI